MYQLNKKIDKYTSYKYMKTLTRHLGMDCRDPEYMDVRIEYQCAYHETYSDAVYCHPWQLDSGNPCRNDGISSVQMTMQLLCDLLEWKYRASKVNQNRDMGDVELCF